MQPVNDRHHSIIQWVPGRHDMTSSAHLLVVWQCQVSVTRSHPLILWHRAWHYQTAVTAAAAGVRHGWAISSYVTLAQTGGQAGVHWLLAPRPSAVVLTHTSTRHQPRVWCACTHISLSSPYVPCVYLPLWNRLFFNCREAPAAASSRTNTFPAPLKLSIDSTCGRSSVEAANSKNLPDLCTRNRSLFLMLCCLPRSSWSLLLQHSAQTGMKTLSLSHTPKDLEMGDCDGKTKSLSCKTDHLCRQREQSIWKINEVHKKDTWNKWRVK